MERRYAQVIWHLLEKGKSLPEAVNAIHPVLARKGHIARMPRIIAALKRIAHAHTRKRTSVLYVAHEHDAVAVKHEIASLVEDTLLIVKVDPTLIGGWRLESKGLLYDHSYKQTLLDMYHTITS